MTEVVPTSNIGQLIANSDSLTELFQVFIEASRPQDLEARSAPVVPYVTEEEATALSSLTELLTITVFPTAIDTLSDDEKDAFLALRAQVDLALEATDRIKESIREAVFNHFDLMAEKAGIVTEDTLVDKRGHYVLVDKENGGSDGSAKKFTREVRRGKTSYGSSVTEADRFKALEDRGLISHQDYLKLTRPARVVDEDRAMALIKRRPELLHVLNAALKTEASSASMYVRANGTDQ